MEKTHPPTPGRDTVVSARRSNSQQKSNENNNRNTLAATQPHGKTLPQTNHEFAYFKGLQMTGHLQSLFALG
jgi:uncharacterized surface anchored protein